MTKLGKIKFTNQEEEQIENFNSEKAVFENEQKVLEKEVLERFKDYVHYNSQYLLLH